MSDLLPCPVEKYQHDYHEECRTCPNRVPTARELVEAMGKEFIGRGGGACCQQQEIDIARKQIIKFAREWLAEKEGGK